mmetsp:Transcript_115649/g.181955  ORF Transcript_115649/g.181955 Transcript_115649/m.181955 type:complete len:174 (-) Transcript_115649:62-583(-)
MDMCLKSYFDKYDADGSGQISKDEFMSLLAQIGLADQMDKDTLEIQMNAMDTNEDGKVTSDEFVTFMKNTPLADTAGSCSSGKSWDYLWSTDKEWMDWFIAQWKYYDKDDNGKITREEFQSMMQECGCLERATSEEFRKLDNDSTGQVSFVEFISWGVENWETLSAAYDASKA